MVKKISTKLGLFLTTVLSLNAGDINFTGSQVDVDPKTTSLPGAPDSVGWRNTTPSKPLVIDGDDIIGTDGYFGRAGDSSPTYITSFGTAGGGNPFGYVDNPLDPQGIDTARAGFRGSTSASQDLFWFTITGADLDGQILGVSIMYDAYGSGTQTYELEREMAGLGEAFLIPFRLVL